jgi:tetratricopeptide (TPR) repeat protein
MNDSPYQKALAELMAGHSEDARQIALACLRDHPQDVDCLQLLGVVAQQLGDLEQAERWLRQAIDVAATARMYSNLGLIRLERGQLAAARDSFEQGLLLEPCHEDCCYGLGLSLQNLREVEPAAAVYRELLERSPGRADAITNLGVIEQIRGNVEEAIACYRRAIDCQDDYAMAHYNLGVALQSEGQLGDAAEAYYRCLQLDGGSADASNNLGIVLMELGRSAEAERSFRRALKASPDFENAWKNLGDLQGQLGQLDEAVDSFRRAVSLFLRKPLPAPTAAAPFDSRLACEALFEARILLDDAGISFFLFAGTLLGIYRDGDLLPYDKDMDIGLTWETDRVAAHAALTAGGQFRLELRDAADEAQQGRYANYRHLRTGVSLDLFYVEPDGDHVLIGSDVLGGSILSRPKSFGLRPFRWQGLDWLIPDECERLLEEFYGTEWRIPDPDFDTVLSSRCQVEATRLARRCYGYSRVYDRLRAGRIDKAQALCRQILAMYHEDDFIKRLDAHLEGRRSA